MQTYAENFISFRFGLVWFGLLRYFLQLLFGFRVPGSGSVFFCVSGLIFVAFSYLMRTCDGERWSRWGVT